MNKRVLLGMSGGVDSSVAAIRLKEQGYEVLGVTFIFSDLQDLNDRNISEAKELAQNLGIEHRVVNLLEDFENLVIQYFIKEYQRGNTPFPCAKCNPELKFDKLLSLAKELGCNFIATGHYANIDSFNGLKYIFKGLDPDKDQSFFLWGLNQEILSRLVLPLGKLNKTETRQTAENEGFRGLSKKKDSLGICFIADGNYREFLASKGIRSEVGNFVDLEGNILGQHSGVFNYTIGQRRGLGINLNTPLFVYKIDVERNEIILSEYKDLYKDRIRIKNCYFADIEEVSSNSIFNLKIRYRLQNTPCKIEIVNQTEAVLILLEPLAMVAKGQTAVIYNRDRVIGGGFICESY